jgi:acyltransferase
MHAKGQSSRCVWMDVAKGIGISLVVIGHMNIPKPLMAYIYCFHVPLFFFLSGLVHRPRPMMDLVARRARTLLAPYLFFSVVGLAVYSLMGMYRVDDYPRLLAGVLYGTARGQYRTPLTPLWFLLCLFTTEVAFAWIVAAAGGRHVRVCVAVALMAAVGFINSKTAQVILPWGTSTSLVAVLFLGLGAGSNRTVSWIRAASIKTKVGIAILLGTVLLLPAHVNGRRGMAYDSYGHIPMFLLGAVTGIGMIVLLSMLVELLYRGVATPGVDKAPLGWMRRLLGVSAAAAVACLLYLGRNTLIILPMHVLASRFAVHCVMELPLRPGSVLNEAVEKSLTLMLLLGSVEVFRRCPLVVPRTRPGMLKSLLRVRPDARASTDALLGCSSGGTPEPSEGS